MTTNKHEVVLPEQDFGKTKNEQGLFRKYEVRRTDGSDFPGGKHDGCEYFVLDMTHDPHAKAAAAAYADSAEMDYPDLAADMRIRYGLDTLARPAEGDFVMVPRAAIERAISTLEADGDEHGVALNLFAMLSAAPQQHEAFAFVNQGDSEANFITDGEHLNCPACGGSGHVDDAQPQQPAEAVALTYDQLFWAISAGVRKVGSDGSKHVSVSAFKEALGIDKSDSLFITPPPTIDIGKLRELVSEWRNDAKHKVIRVMAKQQLADADQLAAIIGDGGERANGR